MKLFYLATVLLGLCDSIAHAQWQQQTINSDADFRGLSVVSEKVAWVSGTCLVTHGKNDIWFCTGGAKTARVFHSEDRGQNWTVSETPILAGTDSAGIFRS